MARAVSFAVLLVVGLAVAAQARQLQQAKFKTVADALSAPENSQLSTLLAAVKAAGLSVPNDASWTIFAPTNKAFEDARIADRTGLSAKQLLEPANKKALTQLLQFHIVPTAALKSTELKDGQKAELKTLEGGSINVYAKDGKVKVWPAKTDAQKAASKDNAPKDGQKKDWSGKGSNVVAADVTAGKAVVHVVDQVLIPQSLRKSKN